MKKRFGLAASEIRSVAPRRGSCLGSDQITVDRKPVGFMYRETPADERDSGWHFFSGEETQEYMDNPEDFEIYDVNTIANCDPQIIPLLDAPTHSAFERDPDLNCFVETDFPEDRRRWLS